MIVRKQGKIAQEPYKKDNYIYTKYYTEEEITKVLMDNDFSIDKIEEVKTTSENGISKEKMVVQATCIK